MAVKSAALVLLLTVAIVWTSGPAYAEWRPDLKLKYQSVYESNIYKAHAEENEVKDQLNDMTLMADWDYMPSLKFSHSFKADASLDMYAGHSNRNRYSFGFQYQPVYEYNRHGKFKLKLSLDHGKKDLIDDNGEVLSRTLGKTRADITAYHYYRTGRMKTTQSFRFARYNYDESYDSFGARLTSYDYQLTEWSLRLSYDFTRMVGCQVAVETEKRSYDERRTLSLDRKSSRVRNYRRNGIAAELDLLPRRWAKLTLETEFNRRKENYENFYGYDEWRYTAGFELKMWKGHSTGISVSYRDKSYDNYYNSNIGLLNRIFVNYSIFELQHQYRLSKKIDLVASVRNLNKVSNDPNYDYHDTEAGLGFEVKM